MIALIEILIASGRASFSSFALLIKSSTLEQSILIIGASVAPLVVGSVGAISED